jgi:hypothetical protein
MLAGKAVDPRGVSLEAMTRSYGPLLFLLTAIWGACRTAALESST